MDYNSSTSCESIFFFWVLHILCVDLIISSVPHTPYLNHANAVSIYLGEYLTHQNSRYPGYSCRDVSRADTPTLARGLSNVYIGIHRD